MTFIPQSGPDRSLTSYARSILRALDSSTLMLTVIALVVVAWIAATIFFGYAGLISVALVAVALAFGLLIRITMG